MHDFTDQYVCDTGAAVEDGEGGQGIQDCDQERDPPAGELGEYREDEDEREAAEAVHGRWKISFYK